MNAADPLSSDRYQQLQQALLRESKAARPGTSKPLDRRQARERGGADSKMDSAEDYVVPRRLPSGPLAATAAPAPAESHLAAAYAALRERESAAQRDKARLQAPACDAEALADAVDALTVHDAVAMLALDYDRLAHQAMAGGDWPRAVQSLERIRGLENLRGSALEEWRTAMATARMGLGEPAAAEALLKDSAPHPDDLKAAWSAMARGYEAWGHHALAEAAHARGCKISRADVAKALQDPESIEALAQDPNLTKAQRAALSRLLEVFEGP